MSRIHPKDDGLPFELQDSDIDLFEKFQRHGPMPSRHVYQFRKLLPPYFKSNQMSQERLNRLTGKGYLFRPEDQDDNSKFFNNYLVHDISRKGKEALRLANRFHDYTPVHAVGRQWTHDFMLSCFTASIELATLEAPGYQFIFHDEIVAPLKGAFHFPVEFVDAKSRKQKRVLKPDRAFGIKYPDGSIRRFLIEADRGTEQNSSSPGRKSIEDNLYQYTEFIGEGLYRDALKVKGGVVVIYLMTSPGKLLNAKTALKELTGGCNYIAFKQVDGFGKRIKPPLPMPELFTAPFERAGKESFYLNK